MRRADIFWGIDISTKSASIGWVNTDGSSRGVVTAVWEDNLTGAARLSAASECVREQAKVLAIDHPAVFAYIEQPSGANRNLNLVYMAGALQVGIHQGLFAHWQRPVEIRTVASTAWKKEVLGRGDYRKPKKGDDFEYQALVWCRENGVEVADDDEADACCIAEYARRVVMFT